MQVFYSVSYDRYSNRGRCEVLQYFDNCMAIKYEEINIVFNYSSYRYLLLHVYI